MKKVSLFFTVLSFLVLFIISACQSSKKVTDGGSEADSYTSQIKAFQKEMNESYKNPKESPLEEKDRKKFTSLPFFKIDEDYKVEANFVRTTDGKPFQMQTTTDRKPIYQKFGEVSFTLHGKNHTLNVYQSQDLAQQEEYKDYLFLPFTDLSNGQESYYGGRYIDLRIPKRETADGQELDKITIDFNKAYNPYCAYNKKYSCPIPPQENHLDIKVLAGVSYEKHE
ncbi:DUF1684 domain-containing protein [Bernardetia sp.]|uniref:DUF1684 domain-containing protein n=1 Tax=Bernardetia sp. TaxID=1937974 RepID=UPI0025BD76EB|nr:DUF1684 domain-containing protein [Bernardetia sp.]